MPKFNKLTASEFSESRIHILRDYHKVKNAIVRFENISREPVFKFIFGNESGSRLWKSFKLNCNSKFDNLKTYLTPSQYDELLINLYFNEEMYSL